MDYPAPNAQTFVARKVKFSSAAAYLGFAGLLAIVQVVTNNQDLIVSFLPPWATVFIAPLVPAVLAFITGWETKHAPQDLNLAVKKR